MAYLTIEIKLVGLSALKILGCSALFFDQIVLKYSWKIKAKRIANKFMNVNVFMYSDVSTFKDFTFTCKVIRETQFSRNCYIITFGILLDFLLFNEI